MLALEAALAVHSCCAGGSAVWITGSNLAQLTGAGIPFPVERAVGGPGGASAVSGTWPCHSSSWHSDTVQGPATSGTRLSPGMSDFGVGRCPLGHNRSLPGWLKPHVLHLSQPRALASQPSSSRKLRKGMFWCRRQVSSGDRCDCLAWLSQDTSLCFSNSLSAGGRR